MVNSFVMYLFRFLNFACLVTVAYYFFSQYLFVSLREKMEMRRLYLQGLLSERKALEGKIAVVEKAIVDQEKQGNLLKKKITLWTSAVADKKKKRIKECKQAASRIIKQRQRQQYGNHLYLMYKEMKPAVFTLATDQLRKEYCQKNNRILFLKKVVADMEKSEKKE